MKAMDAYTIETMGVPSLLLMERAALSAVSILEKEDFSLERVLVLAGNGNNGGDGIAMARLLKEKGVPVDVFMPFKEKGVSIDCQKQIEMAKNYGVSFVVSYCLRDYSCLVDALFGVGLNRELDSGIVSLIKEINASKIPVLAVDIPSGICADSGKVLGEALKAKATVTFQFAKLGILLSPGSSYAGKVAVEAIGIVEGAIEEEDIFQIDKEAWSFFPKSMESANKGTLGKLLVIAGSANMGGAAYLSAKAGFLMGVGMVRIFTSKENKGFLHTLLPEAIVDSYDERWDKKALERAISWANGIVIGPGLGQDDKAVEIFLHTIAFNQGRLPLVVDADGINILKNHKDIMANNRFILTPHLGEMSRLIGKDISFIKENRMELAKNYVKDSEIVLVLKDAKTVVADSKALYLHPYENAGMASAGSGDVLSGMIGGLMTRGSTLSQAAVLGVYLHGLAGKRARLLYGAEAMMAGDLLKELKLLMLKKGMEKEDVREESYLR